MERAKELMKIAESQKNLSPAKKEAIITEAKSSPPVANVTYKPKHELDKNNVKVVKFVYLDNIYIYIFLQIILIIFFCFFCFLYIF